MWLPRPAKRDAFLNILKNLSRQVLLVRGARQVGKTSFALNILDDLTTQPRLHVNFLYPSSFSLGGREYLGRNFFGKSPGGEEFLANIERRLGEIERLAQPAVIFIDEVERYPPALESMQNLAEFSDKLKFVITGSNLENIPVANAATGRKKYFDLYPVTFFEFLRAGGHDELISYARSLSLHKHDHSDFYHARLRELSRAYIRLGGMPRLLDAYLDKTSGTAQPCNEIVKDLAYSIEENVKSVLGDKTGLYEYQDVLRTLARLSMNTLKFTRLQVQHAGQSEAKRLVHKTVGARVAHKIRLSDSAGDLSKYILFDCGLANFLLNGAELLNSTIVPEHWAILLETFVGNELIAGLVAREDLFYWKSGNRAELEFMLRAPVLAGIDVKSGRGDVKSLNSFALAETSADCLVRIADLPVAFEPRHEARLPNAPSRRKIPLLTIPHYLTSRLRDLLAGL